MQPRLARIKERFQLKMSPPSNPPNLSFFLIQLLPSPFLFSFFLSLLTSCDDFFHLHRLRTFFFLPPSRFSFIFSRSLLIPILLFVNVHRLNM